MRESNVLRVMEEAIADRMEQGKHPILQVIWQAKMGTLQALRDGEATPQQVDQSCHNALADGLDFESFLRVQAARNTAAWAAGERDSL